ncbi:MAG: GNAT family N-acetyltransferase [Sedimentitalea sp.]|uniref:GNAT family N-acetyltransferase n=1 Tax=Sedimentitalea sp. TaxID=2048915 RepID=UPI003262DBB0
MPDIEIRQLKKDDVAAFKAIRLEALEMEPAAYASSVEEWVSLSDDEWASRLHMPVFVAFKSGEPVGVMGLLRQKASKMKHRSTLIMVYLRDSARGQGLAESLIDAVARFAAESGVLQIELNVSSENGRAIRFYERNGFRAIGLIPAGMIQDGAEVDEVIMARRLT